MRFEHGAVDLPVFRVTPCGTSLSHDLAAQTARNAHLLRIDRPLLQNVSRQLGVRKPRPSKARKRHSLPRHVGGGGEHAELSKPRVPRTGRRKIRVLFPYPCRQRKEARDAFERMFRRLDVPRNQPVERAHKPRIVIGRTGGGGQKVQSEPFEDADELQRLAHVGNGRVGAVAPPAVRIRKAVEEIHPAGHEERRIRDSRADALRRLAQEARPAVETAAEPSGA